MLKSTEKGPSDESAWFFMRFKKKSVKSFEAVICVTVCVKGSPLAALNVDGAGQFLDPWTLPV